MVAFPAADYVRGEGVRRGEGRDWCGLLDGRFSEGVVDGRCVDEGVVVGG